MKLRRCDYSEVDRIFCRMKLWRVKKKAVIGLKVNNQEKGFQGRSFTVLSTIDIDTNTRNDVVYNTGV